MLLSLHYCDTKTPVLSVYKNGKRHISSILYRHLKTTIITMQYKNSFNKGKTGISKSTVMIGH